MTRAFVLFACIAATFAISGCFARVTYAPKTPVVEFKIPTRDSGPEGIATGPDGNVWFTESKAYKIGRITPQGTINEFEVPTKGAHLFDFKFGRGPFGITAGRDGNMWFTMSDPGEIGRITPKGTVTEFRVPDIGMSYGIAAGPDGNVWFAGEEGKLGLITPRGTITEFAIPAGYSRPPFGIDPSSQANPWFKHDVSHPFAIAAGPDGNLWYTDNTSNIRQIGRITPRGAVTEFAVPTAGTLLGITAGPDGNLWFTESDSSKIGRITPSGAITEFRIGAFSILSIKSDPSGITAGSDGNLWFTEFDINKLGRITPTGTVSEFAIPGASEIGITTGPDGNLWFTEHAANKIGRLTP
jgi:streptogramin lyase